jgi:poly-gamma-glutamate capsule biosynthesis protein CapA/YwtB (metallophosphatase superfamily)
MIQASTQENREQFSAVHRILNERGPDHYSVKAHNEQVERELSLLLKQRSLAQFCEDMAALRSRADVVIASHHWGLDHEVLDYQVEIARTAIDAGADLVMGHGPTCRSGSSSTRTSGSFTASGASPLKPDTAVARIPTGSV